jgi:dihydrofolate synthase/folylpolyglutamate synthase
MASTAYTKSGTEFLLDRIDYERSLAMPYKSHTLKLEQMDELMEHLGSPQRSLRIIHVAGTKGKGSTCHLLESILRAAGYRTGLYTSPHLEDLGERFRIDNRPATPAEIETEIALVRPIVQRMDDEGRAPTFFELTTALAFHYFSRQSVDFAVVEVGLGGRLDSTNVCDPLITAITSISYDHTAILGNTLEEISREKAGIVKQTRPVFTTAWQPEVLNCIREIAEQHAAPFFQLGRDFSIATQSLGNRDTFDTFDVVIANQEEGIGEPPDTTVYSDLQLSVHGSRQQDNTALAVAICHHVAKLGWPVTPDQVRKGVKSAKIPARIEVFSELPYVVVDVAHNEASFRELTSSLERLVAREPCSGMHDKGESRQR